MKLRDAHSSRLNNSKFKEHPNEEIVFLVSDCGIGHRAGLLPTKGQAAKFQRPGFGSVKRKPGPEQQHRRWACGKLAKFLRQECEPQQRQKSEQWRQPESEWLRQFLKQRRYGYDLSPATTQGNSKPRHRRPSAATSPTPQ